MIDRHNSMCYKEISTRINFTYLKKYLLFEIESENRIINYTKP